MRRVASTTGVILPALVALLSGCGDDAACHSDQLECGGSCIGPDSDPNNCGTCGNACGSDATCTGGTCMANVIPPTCDAPKLMCGSDCVDPQTSSAHCGTCAIACVADADCIAGTCEGPLAVVLTSLVGDGSQAPIARDAYVLQDGTLDLTKLDAATFASNRVIDYALLPSGALVLVAAEDSSNVTELYLASPRGGALTKLNPPLVAGGNVQPGLAVSRDGTAILYRADQDTAGVIELYAVSIATAGVSVKVNGALVAGGSVASVFALDGHGRRAAYLADEDTQGLIEAFTVDLSTATPGAPVKLNDVVTGQGVSDLRITDDGATFVYAAVGSAHPNLDIFEVALGAPGVATEISTPIDGGEGGGVEDFALTSDGAVIYTGGSDALQEQLFRAPLAAPASSTVLDTGDTAFVREFAVSPDGSEVYFREGQTLFRVATTGSATRERVSLATATDEDLTTDFALAANGRSLAFRAGVDGAEGPRAASGLDAPSDPDLTAPSLYVVDLTATPLAPVKVSPAVGSGHNGISDGYAVTPDGRVLYRADEDAIGEIDAYLVSAATAGAPVKVSPPLHPATGLGAGSGTGIDADTVSRLSAYP